MLINLITFLFFFTNEQVQQKEKYNLIFEIHFQSHFKNDTLNIKTKECFIGKNILLNSDEELGYANEKFILISMNNKIMIIRNASDTMPCKTSKSYSLDIMLNKKEYNFPINLKKGKYIGFYKDGNGELRLYQSKKRFSYF